MNAMELTEFLLARIAEDEAVAGAAARDGYGAIDWAGESGPTDVHIARWDPARVLAECEAKRRIVEWHESWPVLVQRPMSFDRVDSDVDSMVFRASQQIVWATEREYRARFGDEPPTGPILAALALPYAEHPDYRDEWRQ